ncbi:methyltransferase domain-containing protein [Yoonia sp. R2331]|uniref:methyltransferase domain-containing protein n=1 Tax=Yoonia sp. R2331 TaxID=3237238 RepID=UPI0034E4AA11
MSAPPPLTDRAALLAHRKRAAKNPALFLHEWVADEVNERLQEVNRTFTDIAIVTPWPQVWISRFPDARIIADDDVLNLEQARFDLVIHALTLHWANDLVGQLVQCRRALRPDGLFIGTLFGGETLTELRTALAQAEVAVTGGLSPRIAPMAEIRDLGGLLQRAGFALPVADSVTVPVEYESPLHLMRDLRAMGETNALSDRLRSFTRRELVNKLQDFYVHTMCMDCARYLATFDVVNLTGWAPAESQPKPLRPGSAKARLADALGVPEHDPNTSKS